MDSKEAARKACGDRIRRRRKMKGYTIYQLSRHTGFPSDWLHSVEDGKQCVRVWQAKKIRNEIGGDIGGYVCD